MDNDLKKILKDCEIKDAKFYIGRDFFELNSVIDEHTLREKFYSTYLNSGENFCSSGDIFNKYIEIIKKNSEDYFNNFWLYISNEGEDVFAKKGFVDKVIPKDIFFADKKSKLIEINEIQNISSPFFYKENGWFWILGNDYPSNSYDELFRYYFNFKCNSFEGLTLFFKFIFSEFNARNISFKLKLPLNSKGFNRSDNIVLYIDKLHFWMVAPLIVELHKSISPYLNNNIPLFTKHIAHGIGFAEEPHDLFSFSFGENKINIAIEIIKKLLNKRIDIPNQIFLTEFKKDISSKELVRDTHLNKNSIFKQDINLKPSDTDALTKINYSVFVPNDLYLNSLSNIIYQLCSSAIIPDVKEENLTWLMGVLDFNEKNPFARINVTKTDVSFCNGTLGIGWLLKRSSKILNDFPLQILIDKIAFKANQLDTFEALYFLYDTAYFERAALKVENDTRIVELKHRINFKITAFSQSKDLGFAYLKDFFWLVELLTHRNFKNEFLININKSEIEIILNTITQRNFCDYLPISDDTSINDIFKNLNLPIEDICKTEIINEVIDKMASLTNPPRFAFEAERLISIFIIFYSKLFALKKHLGIENNIEILQILKKFDTINTSHKLKNNIFNLSLIDCHNIDKNLDIALITNSKNESLKKIFITDNDGESLRGRAGNYLFLSKLIHELTFTHQFSDDNSIHNATERYLDVILNDFLIKSIFPDLGFKNSFHNPGISNGIAGLGFLLIKKLYPANSSLTKLPILSFIKL